MGKGRIVSVGPGVAQYDLDVIRDVTYINSRKAKLTDEITALDTKIVTATNEVNSKSLAMASAVTELNNAITAGDQNLIKEKTKNYKDAAASYASAVHALSMLKLALLEKYKDQTSLEGIPETVRHTGAWCVDYTVDLAVGQTVGTIEMNGEGSHVLIRPGGATFTSSMGQLQPTMGGPASQAAWNYAMMPGWQKWKPTYRVGIIVTTDYANEKCDVAIPEPYSLTGYKINQEGESYDFQQAAVSGWSDYAQRNPNDALVKNTESTRLPSTSGLMADLSSVQKYVNSNYEYRPDSEQYGTLEHWSVMDPGGSGDCEDFALTKARLLLQKGYPASALHIEVGKASNGEGHAWLVVQTEEGDYALDILYSNVMLNNRTSHTDRRRQTGTEWSESGVLLRAVTMDYMDGAEHSYEVADRVVVEFVGQSWNNPKVIGFESNPRPPYVDFYISGMAYSYTAPTYFDIWKYHTDGKTISKSQLTTSTNQGVYLTMNPKKKSHYLWEASGSGPSFTFTASERRDDTLEEIAKHTVTGGGITTVYSIIRSRYLLNTDEFLTSAYTDPYVYIFDEDFNVVFRMYSGYSVSGAGFDDYGFDIVSRNETLSGYNTLEYTCIYYDHPLGYETLVPEPAPGWRLPRVNGVAYIESSNKIMYGIRSESLYDPEIGVSVFCSEVRLSAFDDVNNYVSLFKHEGSVYWGHYTFVILGYIPAWGGYCFLAQWRIDNSRYIYIVDGSGTVLSQTYIGSGGTLPTGYFYGHSRLPVLQDV